MSYQLTYKPYGEFSILIEWEAIVNKDIIRDINTYKTKILKKEEREIQDCIIGYHSLLIVYKEILCKVAEKISFLKEVYSLEESVNSKINYVWTIPVCYDLKHGIDLLDISEKTELPVEEIIQLHTNTMYTVYFIGFLPGFLYLGGLNSKLFFDRKSTPRLKVPKGAVAIGGKQTGVYPEESAGGWNIIGNTPLHFFDVTKKVPCFAKSGDQIKFISISEEEYLKIKEEVKKGSYKIEKKVIVNL